MMNMFIYLLAGVGMLVMAIVIVIGIIAIITAVRGDL